MARPGFVHEVNDRTPPLAVHAGSRVSRQAFPLGTSVIYPPEPYRSRIAVRSAARDALASPAGAEPLQAQLRSGMSLTIVFGDAAAAVPPGLLPDVRGQLIEEVLELAAAAGVDEVTLVCARGLRRRLSEPELAEAVGQRVWESFAPLGKIVQHDATADDLRDVAGAQVNPWVADADLVVTVQATDDRARTGSQILTDVVSEIDATAIAAGPGLDLASALGRRLAAALPVFAVEVALDTHPFTEEVGFLAGREWEWGVRDQAKLRALRMGQQLMPDRARARLIEQGRTVAAPLAVHAGDPGEVGAASAAALLGQFQVGVAEQVEVMITGIPQVSPYGVGAWLNPVLAAHLVLHDIERSHTGTPWLVDGGSIIAYGDLEPKFHRHHIAAADFFSDVLADGVAEENLSAAEEAFAGDEWYRHLYRHSEAHHARQPFHLWAQTAPARKRLANIVWVGGDREVCSVLGFRSASTLHDALEMVGALDRSAADRRIGYVHSPPMSILDVTGAS